MERRSRWNRGLFFCFLRYMSHDYSCPDASLVLDGLSLQPLDCNIVCFELPGRNGVNLGLGSARLTKVLDVLKILFNGVGKNNTYCRSDTNKTTGSGQRRVYYSHIHVVALLALPFPTARITPVSLFAVARVFCDYRQCVRTHLTLNYAR